MNSLDPFIWAILLMALGSALVVLEVFLPSGGFLTLLSAAAFIGAILVAYIYKGPMAGTTLLLASAITVPVITALAFKYWPMTSMGRAFLGELPDGDEVSPADPRRELVGRVGLARSKMLPSGAITIDDQTVDAVSQGMAIDAGQFVVVTDVHGNRVVVRPANDNESAGQEDPDAILARPIEELGLGELDIDPLT